MAGLEGVHCTQGKGGWIRGGSLYTGHENWSKDGRIRGGSLYTGHARVAGLEGVHCTQGITASRGSRDVYIWKNNYIAIIHCHTVL